MTVTLTDEQYATIARALVFIAADRGYRENGREYHISREEMLTRARIACAALDLPYRGDGSGNPAFPEEIGWQYRDAPAAKETARGPRLRGRRNVVLAGLVEAT